MDRWRAVLRSADVQAAGGQLDLRPFQVAKLATPEAMSVGDQDHARIAMTIAASLPSRCHQPLDLALGEILAALAD
jgi:hypothetical protein